MQEYGLTIHIRWEELEEKPAEGQWRYFERTEEVGLT